MPTAVKHYANGIALTFTAPLDPEVAQDPDSYHGEQWNYLWSPAYGSADYQPSQRGIEGHDPLEIVSATLLSDQKTVFLEIKDLAPVMQIKIDYQLTAADGHEFRNSYYGTLNKVPVTSVRDSQIVRVPRQRLPAAVEASLKPGVLVKLTNFHDETIVADCAVDRLAAQYIPTDKRLNLQVSNLTTRLRLQYDGYILTPLRGDYVFSLEGTGTARLVINNAEAIAGQANDLTTLESVRVRLRTGYNQFHIDFSGPEAGGGRFRLLWEHESFAREPVPPTALFHHGDDADLRRMQQWREGRQLYVTRQCAACHGRASEAFRPMGELASEPPNLIGSGTRLNQNWVAKWLLVPEWHRQQAQMPALFDLEDPESAKQAADIAAYVATLDEEEHSASPQSPEVLDEDAKSSTIEAGERLYEELACLACHRFTPPEELDGQNRISLGRVGEKYKPGKLSHYLLQPQQHHKGTRMPDFRLSISEAGALAALIVSKGVSSASQSDSAGDPRRGRELFKLKQCVNCHPTSEEERNELKVPFSGPLADGTQGRGCLADTQAMRRNVPRFRLTEHEREALRSVIMNDQLEFSYLLVDFPAEAAERLIHRFNCLACHSRDNDTSPRQLLTVEEGSGILPDAIPQLTWTGEKLRPDWLAKFLAGERHAPLRPWLKARMPAFPAIANVLANGLRSARHHR